MRSPESPTELPAVDFRIGYTEAPRPGRCSSYSRDPASQINTHALCLLIESGSCRLYFRHVHRRPPQKGVDEPVESVADRRDTVLDR
jgi:hypothetical protein